MTIILLIGILTLTSLSGVTASASTVLMPFQKSKLQRMLHSRCHSPLHHISHYHKDDDGGNSAIWSWEGKLTDPATGQLICNVEGIELVRLLSECPSPPPPTRSKKGGQKSRTRELYATIRGLRRLDDLKIRSLLSSSSAKATNGTHNDGVVDWNYAGTILSRKLFVYSAPPQNSQNDSTSSSPSSAATTTLLKSFRKGPTAPVTYIPMDQRVTFYDTATTYISTEGGKGMQLFTEWSDGRWVQSQAKASGFQSASIDNFTEIKETKSTKKESLSKRNKEESVDFTVFCTPTSKRQTPSLLKIARSKSSTPPRSKLIQFGRDEDSEHRRFGARETYTYAFTCPNTSKLSILSSKVRQSVSNLGDTLGLWDATTTSRANGGNQGMGNDSCKVRYTRYGEGPVWYGPGKTCTLELWGEKVSSILSAPALASTLAATRVPGFMTVHTPLPVGPKGGEKGNFGKNCL